MKGIALELSHDRVRTTVRADELPALPSHEPTPVHEPGTTRFAKGNQLWRRRQLKRRATGIATLNPARVPSWLRPHVEQGASYVLALLAMLEGKPALHALAGDCADAHVLYRATLQLAVDAEDAKTRAALMAESRGWLREHRTALATLAALADGLKLPAPDTLPPWYRLADDDEHPRPSNPMPPANGHGLAEDSRDSTEQATPDEPSPDTNGGTP